MIIVGENDVIWRDRPRVTPTSVQSNRYRVPSICSASWLVAAAADQDKKICSIPFHVLITYQHDFN